MFFFRKYTLFLPSFLNSRTFSLTSSLRFLITVMWLMSSLLASALACISSPKSTFRISLDIFSSICNKFVPLLINVSVIFHLYPLPPSQQLVHKPLLHPLQLPVNGAQNFGDAALFKD